ncbi:MAG: trimeric intracellular cation channel family protein [Bacteroidota bacterium]
MEEVVEILDIIGVFVFAISGALTAMRKKLDLFGVFIIAFVAAVGGGTLRDALLGRVPVFWMVYPVTVYAIMVGTFVAIVFRKMLGYLSRTLSLFDTIGLAVFTIIGIEIGTQFNLNPVIILALGVMTGSFGGVIRDVLVNEIPLIFHKEVYATASLLGGMVYMGGLYFNLNLIWNQILSIFVVIIIRSLAVHYSLALPGIYRKEEE